MVTEGKLDKLFPLEAGIGKVDIPNETSLPHGEDFPPPWSENAPSLST
jgi:hypothetical protein